MHHLRSLVTPKLPEDAGFQKIVTSATLPERFSFNARPLRLRLRESPCRQLTPVDFHRVAGTLPPLRTVGTTSHLDIGGSILLHGRPCNLKHTSRSPAFTLLHHLAGSTIPTSELYRDLRAYLVSNGTTS